jgi:hypothetical protein
VAVLRSFDWAMGIDKDLFDPLLLAKHYGDAIVDVVNQDPNATVMKIGPRYSRQLKT